MQTRQNANCYTFLHSGLGLRTKKTSKGHPNLTYRYLPVVTSDYISRHNRAPCLIQCTHSSTSTSWFTTMDATAASPPPPQCLCHTTSRSPSHLSILHPDILILEGLFNSTYKRLSPPCSDPQSLHPYHPYHSVRLRGDLRLRSESFFLSIRPVPTLFVS